MVNSEGFSRRIKEIIDYYSETSSSFADKIQVQRSSISHIISGRNKPSLDFILKTLKVYSEVNMYWLLNGKGSMLSERSVDSVNEPPNLFNPADSKPSLDSGKSLAENVIPFENKEKEIEKIIVLYSDGTFKHYKP